MKERPNSGVLARLSQVNEDQVFVSVVTITELRYGTFRRHIGRRLILSPEPRSGDEARNSLRLAFPLFGRNHNCSGSTMLRNLLRTLRIGPLQEFAEFWLLLPPLSVVDCSSAPSLNPRSFLLWS